MTPQDKAKARTVYLLLVTALLLKKPDSNEMDTEEEPAVAQMATAVDEILQSVVDTRRRQAIIDKVNAARVKLMKKVETTDRAAGIVGAIEVLTTRLVTKKGTRLDYIVATFKKNLPELRKAYGANDKAVSRYKRYMKKYLDAI